MTNETPLNLVAIRTGTSSAELYVLYEGVVLAGVDGVTLIYVMDLHNRELGVSGTNLAETALYVLEDDF
jgi:hypothetical protein